MNIEQIDIWELIKNGYFDEACHKADQEYNKTKDIFPLRNKIYALFHLEKYREIISLSKQLINYRDGETSSDFLSMGIAEWLLFEKQEALESWLKARQSKYKDAAGGIDIESFVYFGATKTNNSRLKVDSIKTIKKILKSKKSVIWPSPIGSYLINEIEETVLMSLVVDIPILKERQLCQAYFAIAIKELENGNTELYRKNLKNSISYGSSSYVEQTYYLAKGELKSIPPTNQTLLG